MTDIVKKLYGKQRPYGSLKGLILMNLNRNKSVEEIATILETNIHVINKAITRMKTNNELPPHIKVE